MSKRKGSNYERELLHMFFESGFHGVRVAGSGSSSLPSPDLIVGRFGFSIAIEVKATSKPAVYVSSEQLNNLMKFASGFGARPVVAVKFIGRGWHFFDVPKTDSKTVGFKDSDSCFFFENFLSKKLDEF